MDAIDIEEYKNRNGGAIEKIERRYQEQIDELKREIELKDWVLKFYADQEHYGFGFEIAHDQGTMARAVLKECEK